MCVAMYKHEHAASDGQSGFSVASNWRKKREIALADRHVVVVVVCDEACFEVEPLTLR